METQELSPKNNAEKSFYGYASERNRLAPLARMLYDIPFEVLMQEDTRDGNGSTSRALPLLVADSVFVAGFLALAAPAAHNAQKRYRIPASVLLGKALYDTAGWRDSFLDEFPSSGGRVEMAVHLWFETEARAITGRRGVKAAIEQFASDPVSLVRQLDKLKVLDPDDAAEIISRIEMYHLKECDIIEAQREAETPTAPPLCTKKRALVLV